LFDVGSPTAYLAYTQLPGIAARQGATIVWTPILLGAVHKATGNVSPAMIPAKGRYMFADLARFAARYGVELQSNPYFPINTMALMRGAVGYQTTDRFAHYLATIFRAMWVEQRNMGDPDMLGATLAEQGLDADDFQTRIGDEAVKAKLKANSEDAVARGVFGAPSCFVGDTLYFGQDRLDFVEEALAALPD